MAELDVNVTEPPAQNVVSPPGVIVGVVGIWVTVTVIPVDGLELQPSDVTITV